MISSSVDYICKDRISSEVTFTGSGSQDFMVSFYDYGGYDLTHNSRI